MTIPETEIIKVATGKSHYYISIGSNIVQKAFEEIFENYRDSKIAIITDSNVERIYDDFLQKLGKNDRVFILSFKAGEESKNRKTKELLEDKL
ncbi:MAG: 3-dehydroquinate synthase, partial [Candidatus Methanofastidiosa archaeon]|nr:3-dehydroquinate synthase [Candidatus Methanofastidiosa archaeon]